MSRPSLEAFHAVARKLNYSVVLESLLIEFGHGNIADHDRTLEDATIRSSLVGPNAAWDLLFPPFPELRGKRRSLTWEYYRGRRDAYLKQLIATFVPGGEPENRLIVNPATVFGRHARWLARAIPTHEVVATDIDPTWNRLYRTACFWKYRHLENFSFERENIFEPSSDRRPTAVTFFGACGSVTDGCMDYAIATESPFLICRSCCHDNIGGNTQIVRRPSLINATFALKNCVLQRTRGFPRYAGHYFSDQHAKDTYPRSAAARDLMDADTVLEIARNSVDSDICRSLIDLDRCLFLQENGYDVVYREELFFAHRPR